MALRTCLFITLIVSSALRADDGEVTKIGDIYVVPIRAVSGLRYDVTRFQVPPGVKVRIDLENTDSMMHNLVVTKPGKRVGVVDAALKMGVDAAAQQFVPKTPDVLWHSSVLEPNAKAKLEFESPTQAGVYPFVCTYPGHGSLMYGAMYVGDQKLPEIAKDDNVPPTVVGDHDTQRKGPRVLRTFLRDCGPAAIAADTGNGISYAFDAGACRLRYAWKGGFVDTATAFSGNGKDFVEPVGRIWWRDGSGFPLRIGDNSQAAPQLKFIGYTIQKGIAEFQYTVDGVAVKERITAIAQPPTQPAPAGHGGHGHAAGHATVPQKAGLVRTIAVGPTELPVTFIADAGSGAAFTSSVGTFENGVLKLSPQQAAGFEITMTEQPGVQPLFYCTMDDRIGTAQPKTGFIGRAGVFDGSKTLVPLGLKSEQLGDSWTFTAWVQADAKMRDAGALFSGVDAATDLFALVYDPADERLHFIRQASSITTPAGQAAEGNKRGDKHAFRHVAAVAEGGSLTIYLQGVDVGKVPMGPAIGKELYLGSAGKKMIFKGLIDEARLFDRALSPDEIRTMIAREEAKAARPQIQR